MSKKPKKVPIKIINEGNAKKLNELDINLKINDKNKKETFYSNVKIHLG